MQNEEEQLRRRFEELADRARTRGKWTFSRFLTPAEQAVLKKSPAGTHAVLLGGHPGAERALAAFGPDGEDTPAQAPVVCLCAAPAAPKFAPALTHRDFLGALMALGLKRETLGDIVVADNCGWVFCDPAAADFIQQNMDRVARTAVRVTRPDTVPALAAALPEISQISAASDRLDALAAAVWNLSRSESRALFSAGRVFVNGGSAENPARACAPGDTVSVRGFGRFDFVGISGETRRGRLRADVRIYR